MTSELERFRRDVDFMWREATQMPMTQAVVGGGLQVDELAMLTLQMYHYVKHTTAVFRDALGLVPAGEEHAPLRAMLAYFAEDEEGHDRIALRDLDALGYDPRACMETLPLPTTLNLHGANKAAVAEYGAYYLVGETYATETVGAEMSAAIHAALVGRPEVARGIGFYRVHGEADLVHAERSASVLAWALEQPGNRRPLLLGCLTAWRNLSLMAAEIGSAREYPPEFQLPPRRR